MHVVEFPSAQLGHMWLLESAHACVVCSCVVGLVAC